MARRRSAGRRRKGRGKKSSFKKLLKNRVGYRM